MTPTEWNWPRLGRAVRTRRKQLRLSQSELAEIAGVHVGTVSNIERGRSSVELPRSAKDLERALGWQAASFESVLEGGEPILVEAAPPQIDPRKLAGAIEHARGSASDDALSSILAADLAPEVKHALLELHRARVAEAQRQSHEDLDRALRERRA